MQAVNHLVCIFVMDKMVVVVVVIYILQQLRVHEVQRIHRLQVGVAHALLRLRHVGLRRVQQHATLERVRPCHLHLHDELALEAVLAAHVDNAVLLSLRPVGYLLGRPVLDALHKLAVLQRQQRVEQADDEVLVLPENLLEGQVGLRVQVFRHCRLTFCLPQRYELFPN